jgi:hypothetical protein
MVRLGLEDSAYAAAQVPKISNAAAARESDNNTPWQNCSRADETNTTTLIEESMGHSDVTMQAWAQEISGTGNYHPVTVLVELGMIVWHDRSALSRLAGRRPHLTRHQRHVLFAAGEGRARRKHHGQKNRRARPGARPDRALRRAGLGPRRQALVFISSADWMRETSTAAPRRSFRSRTRP